MNFTGEWIVRSPFWGEMRLKGVEWQPRIKRYQFLEMDGGFGDDFQTISPRQRCGWNPYPIEKIAI